MIIAHSLKILSSAIALASFIAVQPASAEKLYKWVDKNGNVTYQSDPPPDDALSIERSSIEVQTEEVVEEAPQETLPIKFYVKPDCPQCDQARSYFEQNAVPVSEVDITENTSEAEKMEKQIGHNDVPTFVVGNKAVTGFQEAMLTRILVNSGYKLPTEGEPESAAADEPAVEETPDEAEPDAQADEQADTEAEEEAQAEQ